MNDVNKLSGLWEKCMKDEENAFALLHTALYPELFSYTVKMVKDQDLADDLLQDLFIKFWQNKLRIGKISNVRAYFYRSARSIILNHIKSAKVKESKLEEMPEPDLEFSKEELILSAEIDTELKELMLAALNNLPAKQREIIHMRFYQNLEYLQIAEITGTRYQSVINQVYRAIQVLKAVFTLKNFHAA